MLRLDRGLAATRVALVLCLSLCAPWVHGQATRERGLAHRAFHPPGRPAIPGFEGVPPGQSPPGQSAIDAFVLARLRSEGLEPSVEADRVTLLRRLSLDVLGLPPDVAHVDAFLADEEPEAWEKQVDLALASAHFGERWGAHWLDAARYADSDGFEKDKPREVWFYRDWVLAAINDDTPYDRFVLEQIAGDLLDDLRGEEARQAARVATGFLRNSMVNEEGGIDPEQFRMEALFDRMDAIGKSILGLTIQCAQCHDHKFDPISQREYFGLFSFINSSHEGSETVFTPDEWIARRSVLERVASIEEALRHRTDGWRDAVRAWASRTLEEEPEWEVLALSVDELSTGGQKYLPREDGSLLALGYAPTKHTVQLEARPRAGTITALRLELMNDRDLPRGGPGRSVLGTCALTEIEVSVEAPGRESERLEFASATADVAPPEAPLAARFDDRSQARRVTGPVAFAIDGDDATAWTVDIDPGRRNQPRAAVFQLAAPREIDGTTTLRISLRQNHGGWNSDDNQSYNLGRFRLSVTTSEHVPTRALSDRTRRLLEALRERPDDERVLRQLFSPYRETVEAWRDETAEIDRIWREHPEGASQLVLAERDDPRETHLLHRGDFLQPKDRVESGVPAILHSFPETEPRNRLGFARWLVDPRAPTTFRALVNRVWQSYFGTGLVETAEDLGSQSPPPSHPALLDWLATELVAGGTGLKRLHRAILLSATYRQSSHVTQEALRRDPANRLLARGPRVRVEAEVVRDIALATSGLLDRAIGGASVHPPLPGFLLEPPVSYGPKTWGETSGRHRRGLYIFRYRSIPYPALETFDAPNGDFSCVRRSRSNTPLQALVALNEPVFVEAARALAARVIEADAEDPRSRATWLFRRVLARRPQDPEISTLTTLFEKMRTRYEENRGLARALVGESRGGPVRASGDEAGRSEAELSEAALAAWTIVSRALLNLDEAITKE